MAVARAFQDVFPLLLAWFGILLETHPKVDLREHGGSWMLAHGTTIRVFHFPTVLNGWREGGGVGLFCVC